MTQGVDVRIDFLRSLTCFDVLRQSDTVSSQRQSSMQDETRAKRGAYGCTGADEKLLPESDRQSMIPRGRYDLAEYDRIAR